ncbi:hypothetical protein glysoja_001104 [Glycine soja]|nr:hypothetical protein glysoja_001104 [Glycine soja]
MGALSNIFMLMSFTLSIGIGIWIIQFDRNLREDNTCADVLAKTGPRLRICFISTLWECLSRFKQCHCVVFDLSSAAEIIYSREKEENERHSSSTAKLV